MNNEKFIKKDYRPSQDEIKEQKRGAMVYFYFVFCLVILSVIVAFLESRSGEMGIIGATFCSLVGMFGFTYGLFKVFIKGEANKYFIYALVGSTVIQLIALAVIEFLL